MLRKNRFIMLALVLTFVMILSACGGGNNNANTPAKATNNAAEVTSEPTETASATNAAETSDTIDTSKEVKLKMIFVGPKPIDYDSVFAEINKKLKEKINATLEGEFLDWSDWAQKYPLKLAANEDFDLIYSANWAGYNDQALKGGFLELTDELITKYMPKTKEAMSDVSWDQAKVNGNYP